MLGFIFYKKSPRYVEPKHAADIIRQLPQSIQPVGVFVNESRDTIQRIIADTGIRVIQLSGDEVPADCSGYDVEIWKTFRLLHIDEAKIVNHFNISAAMLDGARNGEYGGSGMFPDVAVALEMKKYHPLVLAGGLNPDNILSAIHQVSPFAVDINSGVELAPGKKDHTKVKRLFEKLGH